MTNRLGGIAASPFCPLFPPQLCLFQKQQSRGSGACLVAALLSRPLLVLVLCLCAAFLCKVCIVSTAMSPTVILIRHAEAEHNATNKSLSLLLLFSGRRALC